MSVAISAVDHMSAPKNYAELFQKYYPYVVNLVAKLGITDDNKEDVASEILTRFMERGFLDKFDPSLVFSYQGNPRPARFKSFLSKFVFTYAQGHLDKQRRLIRREAQICDLPLSDGGSVCKDPGQTRWVDQYGPPSPGHEEAVLNVLMEQNLADALRAHLASVPRRSSGDRCDLVAVFDAVRAQVLDKGCYDINGLKDLFGVSPTAMHTWVWWLKENIASVLGLSLPPRRARTTKPKPVP